MPSLPPTWSLSSTCCRFRPASISPSVAALSCCLTNGRTSRQPRSPGSNARSLRARETSRYSLSPSSFADAPAGLRCVLPSPNGAALSRRAAATSAVVLTGCLRNAKAIARRAQRLGRTFNVCPAGERWPDGSLRPSLEDFIGAGAILRHLPGPKSPEAEAAIAVFEYRQHLLGETIARSSSGRELIERGFPQDVEIASALDVSTQAPTFDALAFTA